MSTEVENQLEMEIDKPKLEDSLPLVFAELIKYKDQQRDVDDLLGTVYKIPRGSIFEILISPEKFDLLNEFEKCQFIIAMHKVTRLEIINPSYFYSQKHINKSLKYRSENNEEIEFPYVIDGVVRTSEKAFLTAMSYKEIARLWSSGLLTYNYETQRPSKKTMMKNLKIKKTPTIILKSVKNITRLMLERKFLPSTLVFNVLADGNDDIDYDNGELIIGEGTQINLIDGMHRLQGILSVLETDPDFEDTMEISIRHYDINTARYLIGLLNTVNRFDKNLVKFNTDDTFGGLITKDLIEIRELKDRVEKESTAVRKKLNMLTNYSVMADSINSIFDPQSTKDQYDILAMLKIFFGYLISAYPDDFTNQMAKSRAVSWFNHHNMMVGFTVIAKALYDKYNGVNFPVSEITRIIDSIDFKKGTGSRLDAIMLEQGNRNSNQSKALIRKLFEEKVSELL